MKKLATLSLLALAACASFADNGNGHPHGMPPGQAKKLAACDDCGTVHAVHKEKRKGDGGAVGIVSGAAVGGLLGNQIGKGNGRALATVGGAVAGGFAGNEVQKHVTSTDVWVTEVRLKDGSVRRFEQSAAPAWKAGAVVRVQGKALSGV
jgi:outer membrane lipoprotein SlyB